MTDIYFWIDDERPMPDGYNYWAKTSDEAISMLAKLGADDKLIVVSFDHDLGYSWEEGHSKIDGNIRDDTTRPVATWMVENEVYPEVVIIHSQNPIGARWLEQTFLGYGVPPIRVIREAFRA